MSKTDVVVTPYFYMSTLLLCIFLTTQYLSYRSIFPIGKYFFLISIIDDSKEYRPTSKTIIDVPTAINFFARPGIALEKIGISVRRMMAQWNEKYAGSQEVKIESFVIIALKFVFFTFIILSYYLSFLALFAFGNFCSVIVHIQGPSWKNRPDSRSH